jgi:peptidoglycan hydrolase-like protein with peptidoglycan-binding domain
MSYRTTIEKLIHDHSVGSVLTRGSSAKGDIRALQNLLNELGFDSELNWKQYGGDGAYGKSTTAAVAAFAAKNQLAGDGHTVTREMAKVILARYDILDELRYLSSLVRRKEVEKRIYFGSQDRVGVGSVQTLLNELGFGEQLNWEKYAADGHYGEGTVKAVKAFAGQEGIAGNDGKRLDHDLAVRLIQRFEGFLGANWAAAQSVSSKTTTTAGGLRLREVTEKNRPRLYISDGSVECRFTKFKKGVYLYGQQRPLDFIRSNKSSLAGLGLTDSAINVMAAVSENEGNLDAVNTWDNSFMTFGMFQWTIGAGSNKGELPALLKKIKAIDPDVFDRYFGSYGLDIADTDDIYGYFSLDGKKIAGSGDKEALRSNQWAFYFWKSAQDPVVQSGQIQHAASRLNTFYRSNRYKIDGYFIADLITSEYGIGLVLDNHVNRPGYVAPCLKAAMARSGLGDPQAWGTEQELQLIDAYLEIRKSYGKSPMTHADKRAAVTKKFLNSGVISAQRGSFQQARE